MTQLWLRFGFTCAKMASKSILVVFKVKESGDLKKNPAESPRGKKKHPLLASHLRTLKTVLGRKPAGSRHITSISIKKKLGVKNAYISTPLM